MQRTETPAYWVEPPFEVEFRDGLFHLELPSGGQAVHLRMTANAATRLAASIRLKVDEFYRRPVAEVIPLFAGDGSRKQGRAGNGQ